MRVMCIEKFERGGGLLRKFIATVLPETKK
jgi:hypothetical protein